MKRTKRFVFFAGVFALAPAVFAAGGGERLSMTATKRFITGNISDKTRAVTEAAGDEAYALSREALSFALTYRRILGEDKGLSALAVAGVLSLKAEDVQRLSSGEKDDLAKDICGIYTQFSEEAVRSAALNRAVSLKGELPLEEFVALLNQDVQEGKASREVTAALMEVGDEGSFAALWEAGDGEDEQAEEALAAILCRVPNAKRCALEIVRGGDEEDLERMLFLAERDGVSDAIRGEAAEAVLQSTAPGRKGKAHALSILKELRWTRASKLVYSLLLEKKDEWDANGGQEEDMASVIEASSILSPIDCGSVISQVLINEADKGTKASEKVISSCIQALRTIGDKGAFDALLAVTNAPGINGSLKASANSALSSLKW